MLASKIIVWIRYLSAFYIYTGFQFTKFCLKHANDMLSISQLQCIQIWESQLRGTTVSCTPGVW